MTGNTLEQLIDVATGKLPHDYLGDCPDQFDPSSRDRACPACRAIEAALRLPAGEGDRIRPGYAGVHVWIGQQHIQLLATEPMVTHLPRGEAITNLCQEALDALAAAPRHETGEG